MGLPMNSMLKELVLKEKWKPMIKWYTPTKDKIMSMVPKYTKYDVYTLQILKDSN